ncbi:MAG TPA: hypothetical protein VJL89_10020 [Thermodesulfovibrionia bacterium]|nr:hypothetical protein [Candidatus Woesearchaeota archaeon]HLC16547.1 hypothetical protein [Thermodesulfovibrionia bacterium]
MSETTTVQLNKEIVESLKKIKEHPRQSYNELIARMVDIFKKAKSNNQYDEFLHKIQQHKMKELWDNKEDVEWENA